MQKTNESDPSLLLLLSVDFYETTPKVPAVVFNCKAGARVFLRSFSEWAGKLYLQDLQKNFLQSLFIT